MTNVFSIICSCAALNSCQQVYAGHNRLTIKVKNPKKYLALWLGLNRKSPACQNKKSKVICQSEWITVQPNIFVTGCISIINFIQPIPKRL